MDRTHNGPVMVVSPQGGTCYLRVRKRVGVRVGVRMKKRASLQRSSEIVRRRKTRMRLQGSAKDILMLTLKVLTIAGRGYLHVRYGYRTGGT